MKISTDDGSRLKFRMPYDRAEDERQGELAACRMVDADGCPQESLTQQSFAAAADLNEIVRRCGIKDHDLPYPPPIDPKFYGDVSEMPDLRTALDRIKDATDRFNALPANLRAKFHNRPDLLHEFVSDPRNFEECCVLGLLAKPPEEKKAEPVVAPPVVAATSSSPQSSV